MSVENPNRITSDTAAGARAATVRDLNTLKSPKEGGTKKEYEDFLEKIRNHVPQQPLKIRGGS